MRNQIISLNVDPGQLVARASERRIANAHEDKANDVECDREERYVTGSWRKPGSVETANRGPLHQCRSQSLKPTALGSVQARQQHVLEYKGGPEKNNQAAK